MRRLEEKRVLQEQLEAQGHAGEQSGLNKKRKSSAPSTPGAGSSSDTRKPGKGSNEVVKAVKKNKERDEDTSAESLRTGRLASKARKAGKANALWYAGDAEINKVSSFLTITKL